MFYENIFAALEKRGVRYLVVGGVAVVLQGFVRATADLDLMVALDSRNLKSFLALMSRRGYRPKMPVALEEFADEEARRSWISEKGMRVFSLYHPRRHGELVDVFVDEPIPFEKAYARRDRVSIGRLKVSVAGVRDLIALKRAAGRPQDLEDIKALQAIRGRRRK